MPYTPGPFDRNHLLLVWGGSLPGNETWSCSVKLADGRIASPALGNDAFLSTINTQSWVDGFIADAVLAYHVNPNTHIAAFARLQYCKLNLINRDGHYDSENSSEHVFVDTNGGGGTSPVPPNQIALCVSLTTGYNRGAAHRGRFYLPTPLLSVDETSGQISATDANQVAATTKTFLEAISDVPGLDLASSPGAVVMSRKAGSPKTRIVTGVEIGRVLDTQRRRRRSLVEAYRGTSVDQGLA